VVSLFGTKIRSQQLLNLDRDQVQKYADTLDAVWYSVKYLIQFT
jgi:hypothetical protein